MCGVGCVRKGGTSARRSRGWGRARARGDVIFVLWEVASCVPEAIRD